MVLAAVLLLGFLLRVFYAPALGLHGHSFVVDEQEYYSAALTLSQGRGFSFYDSFTWTRAPLYVVFLAAIFRVFGTDLTPVYVLQAAFSTATVFLLALIAGRVAARTTLLTPQTATLATAVIGSFWLSFTLFSGLLLSETLFLLLFVGSFYLLAVWVDKRSWWLVAVAGVLLGLAALTRSTALGFVPLAAGWVGWVGRGGPNPQPLPRGGRGAGWAGGRGSALEGRENPNPQPLPRGGRGTAVSASGSPSPAGKGLGVRVLVPPLILLAAVAIVVLPWLARNYAAYGRLVLIDTTGGYNLWLASVGVRNEERLATELRGVDGAIAKQDFAYAEAFKNIGADPVGFIGKGLKESVDLWVINPSAEERQIGGYSQGRVPAVHLLALFTLEDLLYVAIVALALAGLLAARRDGLTWLALLWVLLWVVMAFVFFAVNRFRFPMIAALLPWVPLGAAVLSRRPVKWRAWVLPGVAALLLVLTLPFDVTWLGVTRWFAQEPYRQAEQKVVAGDFAAARTLYQQANGQLADTQFALDAVDINLDRGNTDLLTQIAARPELAADLNAPATARFEPFLLQGALAMLRDDATAAKAYWGARPVDDNALDALDWASKHLALDAPAKIDVGSKTDLPFLTGFYAPENTAGMDYRWTSANVTLKVGGADSQRVAIRWSGWRPEVVPAARVGVSWRVCMDCAWTDGATVELPTTDTWQEDELGAPAGSQVRLVVNGFVPGGFDPRELGVRVDWVAVR